MSTLLYLASSLPTDSHCIEFLCFIILLFLNAILLCAFVPKPNICEFSELILCMYFMRVC